MMGLSLRLGLGNGPGVVPPPGYAFVTTTDSSGSRVIVTTTDSTGARRLVATRTS